MENIIKTEKLMPKRIYLNNIELYILKHALELYDLNIEEFTEKEQKDFNKLLYKITKPNS